MRSRGFTLFELLIVVAVLAVAASIALLDRGTADAQRRVAVAASEVASALRFARDEARRTGAHHGAEIAAASARIRVFRLDTSGPPTPVFDVIHPIDKRLYDITLRTAPFSGGVTVTTSGFTFDPSPVLESVAFDPSGTPVSPVSLRRLLSGQVTVQFGDHIETATVAPLTGRVTVP